METVISNEETIKILGKEFAEYDYRDVNAIVSVLSAGLESNRAIRSVQIATTTGHLYRSGAFSLMDIGETRNALLRRGRTRGPGRAARPLARRP